MFAVNDWGQPRKQREAALRHDHLQAYREADEARYILGRKIGFNHNRTMALARAGIHIQKRATADFRKLNGLRKLRCETPPAAISDGRYGSISFPALDHIYGAKFTGSGGAKVIISQPYPHIPDIAHAMTYARDTGVRLDFAPDVFASFHNPGSCMIFAICEPHAPAIKWLPEQCGNTWTARRYEWPAVADSTRELVELIDTYKREGVTEAIERAAGGSVRTYRGWLAL